MILPRCWSAPCLLLAGLLAAGPALGQAAAPRTDAPACQSVAAPCLHYTHPNHRNCGTRGGPGCRKAKGSCAAWRDGYTPSCARTGAPRP
ncbi:hypothetical protein [Falsiroseomonas sp.]|uniref:hypothetical protein n=1 Tax=Falsiroseomonas sp. TaxID=2870721 RepID=UPI003F717EF2